MSLEAQIYIENYLLGFAGDGVQAAFERDVNGLGFCWSLSKGSVRLSRWFAWLDPGLASATGRFHAEFDIMTISVPPHVRPEELSTREEATHWESVYASELLPDDWVALGGKRVDAVSKSTDGRVMVSLAGEEEPRQMPSGGHVLRVIRAGSAGDKVI
jgi:hypothetical protein